MPFWVISERIWLVFDKKEKILRKWVKAAAYGDAKTLRELCMERPELANARLRGLMVETRFWMEGMAGHTPLEAAVRLSSLAGVALLAPLTDVNILGPHGKTPLILAATNRDDACAAQIIQLILPFAAPNVAENRVFGRTALMTAVASNNFQAAQVLLADKRLDVAIQDCEGRDALSLAASYHFFGLVQLLLPRATPDSRGQAFEEARAPQSTPSELKLLDIAPFNITNCWDLLSEHADSQSVNRALDQLGATAPRLMPRATARRESEELQAVFQQHTSFEPNASPMLLGMPRALGNPPPVMAPGASGDATEDPSSDIARSSIRGRRL